MNPKFLSHREVSKQNCEEFAEMDVEERTYKNIANAEQLGSCSTVGSCNCVVLIVLLAECLQWIFNNFFSIFAGSTHSRRRGFMDNTAVNEALKKRKRAKEHVDHSTAVKAALSSQTTSEKE